MKRIFNLKFLGLAAVLATAFNAASAQMYTHWCRTTAGTYWLADLMYVGESCVVWHNYWGWLYGFAILW